MSELSAFTRASQLVTGQKINVYTKSRYVFGVVFDFGMRWKQSAFLILAGIPIKNVQQVKKLLDILLNLRGRYYKG